MKSFIILLAALFTLASCQKSNIAKTPFVKITIPAGTGQISFDAFMFWRSVTDPLGSAHLASIANDSVDQTFTLVSTRNVSFANYGDWTVLALNNVTGNGSLILQYGQNGIVTKTHSLILTKGAMNFDGYAITNLVDLNYTVK